MSNMHCGYLYCSMNRLSCNLFIVMFLQLGTRGMLAIGMSENQSFMRSQLINVMAVKQPMRDDGANLEDHEQPISASAATHSDSNNSEISASESVANINNKLFYYSNHFGGNGKRKMEFIDFLGVGSSGENAC